VRLSRCELRGHINCRKNDRWPSYRFYWALQRLKSPMRYICEIFGAQRFLSFSTQSAQGSLCQKTTVSNRLDPPRVESPYPIKELAPSQGWRALHDSLLVYLTLTHL
jgi:hypothetical protein